MKSYVPYVSTVTTETGLLSSVKNAMPGPVYVQIPVPKLKLPVNVNVRSHSSPPCPASANVCCSNVTTTSSLSEQLPFTSVQVKVYSPRADTVTTALGSEVLGAKVAVPGPLYVQVPRPTLAFAANGKS